MTVSNNPQNQNAPDETRGWSIGCEKYTCTDRVSITVPRRTANIRDLRDQKTRPSNGIWYTARSQRYLLRVAVSGVEFSGHMRTLFGGSDGVRTLILPKMVRAVQQGAFYQVESLRSVLLNEGLETLGDDRYQRDRRMSFGAFQESGLRRMRLPSTLKRIAHRAFMDCKALRTVSFPTGLEHLGKSCFSGAGLESVELPASLRTVSQAAFSLCRHLKSAKFAEGLEALGTEDYAQAGGWYGAFEKSALENVELPSTLKRIEFATFSGCGDLKDILLPEGLEYIGKECFYKSGLKSVRLPLGLRRIEPDTFGDCESLRNVQLPDGLEVIGKGAFCDSAVEEIRFPTGVKRVFEGAFNGCAKLRRVTLNEGLETLGEKATTCGREVEGTTFSGSGIESVAIPSTLKAIEGKTFSYCASLRSVTFPENS